MITLNTRRAVIMFLLGVAVNVTLLLGYSGHSHAQLTLNVIHDFPFSGQKPVSRLIEASDGILYGTTQEGGSFNQGTAFKINKDGTGLSLLHSFQCATTNGCNPVAGLIEASDGVLYGTTQGGGSFGQGTVFKINKDGTGFLLLESFLCGTNGCSPTAELIEGSDGVLYGTTQGGGSSNQGTAFKINKDGTGFSLLQSFQCTTTSGCFPSAGLIEAIDGVLYGTTQQGGSFNQGTAFKINKDGTGFSLLQSFQCSVSTNGCNPVAELIEGSDGVLYGTTRSGGSSNQGTAFKINKDGTGFSLLHSFQCTTTNGCTPVAGLIEGSDGVLYGTTQDGGSFNAGTVFKMNKDGTGFSLLQSFQCNVSTNGCTPVAGLIEGSDGVLYGTTRSGGSSLQGTAFKINKDGSGFSLLQSFQCGGSTDGCFPRADLIEGSDGVLYGTTQNGGAFNAGTVFKINKDGSGFSLLQSFRCTVSTNGCNPIAGLIEASDGVLYGTTQNGGAFGPGTAFKINKDGTGFSLLHSFQCTTTNGCFPTAGLIEASDGVIYGTTQSGGSFGRGTVFKINKDGTGFSLLRSFQCTTADGCSPFAGLIEGSDGMLYATTQSGGAFNAGTAFKINKDGTGFSLLQSFQCGVSTSGCNPVAKLIKGSDGVLYGTTQSGGSFGPGTAFKINKDGTGLSLLHSFQCTTSNGCFPSAGLIEASDGALYGTTQNGGSFNGGTAFKINKDGTGFSLLHSFQCTTTNGCFPTAGLIQASDGALYGTTQQGGGGGAGIVYGLVPDNAAPVANAGGPYSVNEGGSVQLNAGGSTDPDGDPLTFSWDLDNNSSFESSGQSPTFSAAGRDGPDTQTIVLKVCDSLGACSTAQATVNIQNLAPVVGNITAPLDPVPVNTAVNASSSFTDAGTPDTHTAQWSWGDGSSSAGTVTQGSGSGSVSNSHTYTTPGIYTLKLTVTDDDGGAASSEFKYVVIYDPNGGFVTGSGWINSPAGAYVADPSLTGKANFGFASKYKQGTTAPTGTTQFKFHDGNFDFSSSSYEWLVVSGARAQFKGTGTVNGGGNYGFILTAIDGQVSGGGGVDKFRIKIWDKNNGDAIVYDNQMGATDDSDPTTVIGAGSILIHTGGK